MEEDNRHTNQLDDFSRIVKDKLKDHRLPLEKDSWEEMDALLIKQDRKRMWWPVGGIAAAVAALLLLFYLPGRNNNFEPLETISKDTLVEEKEPPATPEESVPELIEPVSKKLVKQKVTASSASNPSLNIIQGIIDNQTDSEEKKEDQPVTSQQEEAKQTEDITAKRIPLQGKKGGGLYVDEAYYDVPRSTRKKDNRIQLASVVGTGGNVSFLSLGGDSYLYNKDDYNSVSPEYPNIGNGIKPDPLIPDYLRSPNPDNFQDVNYMPPFSFGFTTRMYLSERIGLETGLVYTYLITKMETVGNPHVKARLKNHYLGIPLNVVVDAWHDSLWGIYFSAGGMIEKGLRSVYTVDEDFTDHASSHIFKYNINGVQCSLQAALGVSYRITREWDLYLEPRFSYYFENDQPPSVRTDKPVVVGIGGGVRYNF